MADPTNMGESPFDQHIGTEFLDLGPELATARVPVQDHHLQPFGVVHGGVFCAVAESVTSRATGLAVFGDGMQPLGQSNNSSFLRPISGGTIHVEARRRHGGRTSWIWDVEISDDEGRVCALSRITIAIRPIRS